MLNRKYVHTKQKVESDVGNLWEAINKHDPGLQKTSANAKPEVCTYKTGSGK